MKVIEHKYWWTHLNDCACPGCLYVAGGAQLLRLYGRALSDATSVRQAEAILDTSTEVSLSSVWLLRAQELSQVG